MKTYRLAALILMLLLIGIIGCSVQNLEARLVPDSNLSPQASYYVIRHEQDTRSIDVTIAKQLKTMGLHNISSGPEINKPKDTDIIVLYEDRWMWDITNYLIFLKIQFRDAESNLLLARGKSYRTSLVRKSVDEMVQETLVAIFNTNTGEVQK